MTPKEMYDYNRYELSLYYFEEKGKDHLTTVEEFMVKEHNYIDDVVMINLIRVTYACFKNKYPNHDKLWSAIRYVINNHHRRGCIKEASTFSGLSSKYICLYYDKFIKKCGYVSMYSRYHNRYISLSSIESFIEDETITNNIIPND